MKFLNWKSDQGSADSKLCFLRGEKHNFHAINFVAGDFIVVSLFTGYSLMFSEKTLPTNTNFYLWSCKVHSTVYSVSQWSQNKEVALRGKNNTSLTLICRTVFVSGYWKRSGSEARKQPRSWGRYGVRRRDRLLGRR